MVKKLIFLQNQILHQTKNNQFEMLLSAKSIFKNHEIIIYFYMNLCCTKIKKFDGYEMKESILRLENEDVFDECIETSIKLGFIKTGMDTERHIINDIENIEQYDVYNTQEFLDVLNRYRYDLLLMCDICMYTGCYSDFFHKDGCLEEWTDDTYICKKCVDENEDESKKYNLLDSLDIKIVNIHIGKLIENQE